MTELTVDRPLLQKYQKQYHEELYERVLPFWMNHSLDHRYGGYYNCLDEDGKPYDSTKHIWLQGRQVWMLSRIHNRFHKPGEESKWLEYARSGANFLRNNARTDDRVYFSLTRDGKPHFIQRKMFSECFYVMAMAEYSRASGDESAMKEARDLFEAVQRYAKDPSVLGRPSYPHLPATSSLAVPMILLNLIEEVNGPDGNGYEELSRWCVTQIDLHYRPELHLVLEHVGKDGNLIDSPEGRLVSPGHAIECGWFLLAYAVKTGHSKLKQKALDMIDWSFNFGWDKEHGGIYYFMDREGYSPTQLEWNMKLWWPHNEAQVAFLMAYKETGDVHYFERFIQVTDYAFEHFSDKKYGEWYGYMDRYGNRTHRFKGGPYKGCFHVPRALFLCDEMLQKLLDR